MNKRRRVRPLNHLISDSLAAKHDPLATVALLVGRGPSAWARGDEGRTAGMWVPGTQVRVSWVTDAERGLGDLLVEE